MSMPAPRFPDGHKLTQDDLHDLEQAGKVLKLKADQKQIWNRTQATGTGMYWHVLYGHHQNHREVMDTVESAGGKLTGSRHSPSCSSCDISKLTMKRTFRGGPQGLEEQIEGMTGQNYKVPDNKKAEVSKTIADIKREAMIRLEDLELKAPIITETQEAPVGAHLFMDFVEWSYGNNQSVKLVVFTDATTSAGYPVMVDKKSEAPQATPSNSQHAEILWTHGQGDHLRPSWRKYGIGYECDMSSFKHQKKSSYSTQPVPEQHRREQDQESEEHDYGHALS